jgi:hypothetical protein
MGCVLSIKLKKDPELVIKESDSKRAEKENQTLVDKIKLSNDQEEKPILRK